MHFPPFKGLIAFDAVARLGSISRAADELSLTVSAVSHQLTNLEAFVGRQLFDRTPRGLTLTIHGERFQSDVTGALTMIASAAQNVRTGEVAEVLRIHAVPTFAGLWLMPRLPSFRARHPALRVQLSATYGDSDFARADVDVDIRYGLPTGRDLHVETLFPEQILPDDQPDAEGDAAHRDRGGPGRPGPYPVGADAGAVAALVRGPRRRRRPGSATASRSTARRWSSTRRSRASASRSTATASPRRHWRAATSCRCSTTARA